MWWLVKNPSKVTIWLFFRAGKQAGRLMWAENLRVRTLGRITCPLRPSCTKQNSVRHHFLSLPVPLSSHFKTDHNKHHYCHLRCKWMVLRFQACVPEKQLYADPWATKWFFLAAHLIIWRFCWTEAWIFKNITFHLLTNNCSTRFKGKIHLPLPKTFSYMRLWL